MNAETNYSHPESPIRQSYPLAVTEKGVVAALALSLKTLPFMGLRLGLMMGFTVLSFVWFAFVLGIAAAIGGRSGGNFGIVVFLLGLGLPYATFVWFKKYFLFVLKMAHIAVLTRLMTHGSLDGESQISYGKEKVKYHFAEINLLLVLDGLVHGIVSAFTRTLNWLVDFLPIPGIDGPMRLISRILEYATRYVGETIFSYNLARDDENPWRSSKDGLIYYAQNWKPILTTAVYALVLEYALTFVIFGVFLAPAYGISVILPKIGAWFILFALLLALNFKSAVLRPIFLTMVMLTYHESVHNEPINLEWDQRLESATEQFKDLSDRAKTWVSEKSPLPAPENAAIPQVNL